MTLNEVKNILPDVKVKYHGIIYAGQVRGRKCDYATIYFNDVHADWSWESVTRAVSQNTPLVY